MPGDAGQGGRVDVVALGRAAVRRPAISPGRHQRAWASVSPAHRGSPSSRAASARRSAMKA